jgi:1,4-dihydroxy-2-naphthoate octaprenyltransferase
VGALLAVLLNAQFSLSKFAIGYAIIFLSTMAIQYHNDYFDFDADRHVTPTVISGGSGILVENPEWKELSKITAIVLISLANVISIAFTVIFSYPITFVLYVIFANFLSWFYDAPPTRLSYRGLGEFITISMGLLYPGLGYFILMGTLDIRFFIFAVPMIFLQTVFTSSVEIPDMEGDIIAGKMTWIASKGREFGFRLIVISGLLVTISFLIIPFTNMFPAIIDFRILAVISLLPLSLGVIELIKKPLDKASATKFCIYNIISIFTSAILINGYFAYLIMS